MTDRDSSSAECFPILLVEDEFEVSKEIALALERQGHVVYIVERQDQIAEAIQDYRPSVLILDRMLHGSDALPLIALIRRDGNKIPVLVVSAMSSVDDRIRGLQSGGDDYLVKPFAMGELLARVEALHRRVGDDVRVAVLRVGPLVMDLIDRTVHRDQRRLDLLPREFNLLEYLMRRPNQIVTREMLLRDVWHFRELRETNVIDVHIGKLRRKVDALGESPLLETVRAIGFVLRADSATK